MKTKFLISILLLATLVSCTKKDDPLNQENNQSASTVTDKDGNIYHTVSIGTQTWMVENLKTTKYNDGSVIPNVKAGLEWDNLLTGAYCNYSNDEAYVKTYGRLYNWYSVNTGKLAPKGWHVPNNADWTILYNYLGGESSGGKLKSKEGWVTPNTGATNESGFSALPAGALYWGEGYEFDGIGNETRLWSTNQVNSSDSYHWHLSNLNGSFFKNANSGKESGFSVRCLKD